LFCGYPTLPNYYNANTRNTQEVFVKEMTNGKTKNDNEMTRKTGGWNISFHPPKENHRSMI